MQIIIVEKLAYIIIYFFLRIFTKILINVVYVLPEEYRRQLELIDWSGEDLGERFEGDQDDLMAFDEVNIEAEICEAKTKITEALDSNNDIEKFVFEKLTLAMTKHVRPLYITAMIGT